MPSRQALSNSPYRRGRMPISRPRRRLRQGYIRNHFSCDYHNASAHAKCFVGERGHYKYHQNKLAGVRRRETVDIMKTSRHYFDTPYSGGRR